MALLVYTKEVYSPSSNVIEVLRVLNSPFCHSVYSFLSGGDRHSCQSEYGIHQLVNLTKGVKTIHIDFVLRFAIVGQSLLQMVGYVVQ